MVGFCDDEEGVPKENGVGVGAGESFFSAETAAEPNAKGARALPPLVAFLSVAVDDEPNENGDAGDASFFCAEVDAPAAAAAGAPNANGAGAGAASFLAGEPNANGVGALSFFSAVLLELEAAGAPNENGVDVVAGFAALLVVSAVDGVPNENGALEADAPLLALAVPFETGGVAGAKENEGAAAALGVDVPFVTLAGAPKLKAPAGEEVVPVEAGVVVLSG